MDKERRKQLMQEYRDRKPEMGVVSIRCNTTGDTYLGISTDTRESFNSIRGRFFLSGHPNKELQALWDRYGEDDFTFAVEQVLKYEDPKADHTRELNELYEKCLAADSSAKRIWK